MLFTIIVLAVVAALVVYVTKKTKNEPTNVVGESVPSIHEEIAKTVEVAKNLSPVTETAKPAKKKTAPKAAKVEISAPAPTMSAKKTIPKAKK
jgi:hypothetical protein